MSILRLATFSFLLIASVAKADPISLPGPGGHPLPILLPESAGETETTAARSHVG